MKWRFSRADAASQGRSISQAAGRKFSPGCMAGFFLVFLLAGLGFLAFFLVPAMKVVAARSWTAVDCEILASSVASHAGDDGATYSVEVRYRYEVDGVVYEGDRYEFMLGSSSGRAAKQRRVDALPVRSTARCYVDPQDPAEAVVYRGFTWVYLFALLPLVFMAVGGGGMAWALTAGRRAVEGKSPGQALASAGGGTFREIDSWGTPVVAAGPVELEEELSPWGKLGCLIGITVFWNGIVSIFVWQIWREWSAGHGFNGCVAVFLIPFVLVGLLFLFGIPYQLLALANPRPRLTLSRAGVPLGGSAQLAWRFAGAAQRLRDLRIWIEGTESATYRRGTSSYTDTEVFATIEVVDLRRGMPLAQGSATIEIPADTMHSFEAAHNKILWTLKLTGSIVRWPDVITEFPFVVQPGAGSEG